MSTTLAESEILKPKSPAITDSDDWEEFTLTNVEIRNSQTGQLASLLHAHPYSPVTVTGRLAPVKRHQEKYLLPRTSFFKNPSVEIPSTAQHSWGQYESGEFSFWVEGQAGWFHITPARSYREIYEEMVEAIKLLFFVADIYGKAKKKGPNSQLLFEECIEDSRFTCASPDEVVDLFQKHRRFLIMAMLDGKENVNWGPTAILDYFKATYPDEVESLILQLNGQPSVKSKQKSSAASTNSKQQGLKQNKVPRKDENWWKAKVIWSLLQRCLAQNIINEEEMTISRFAHVLLKRYELSDEDQAANAIRLQAHNLRYLIEKIHESSHNRLGVEWLKLPIYTELGYTPLPAAATRQMNDIELRPRRVPLKDSDAESESEESAMEGLTSRTRRLRAGKSSALRPKSSKVSKKATESRRGKYYQTSNLSLTTADRMDIDEGEDEAIKTIEIEDMLPGNIASKRRNDDNTADIRPRKRGSSAALTTPLSPALSTSTSGDSSPSEPLTQRLPLRWKPPQKSGNIAAGGGDGSDSPFSETVYLPTVTSQRLPLTAANAPGDVFACPYDGCLHRVYDASSDAAQALIKEHVRRHLPSQRDRLELVRDVEQRSNLPVGNLINRIRQMAELQQNVYQSPLAGGGGPATALLQQVQRKF